MIQIDISKCQNVWSLMLKLFLLGIKLGSSDLKIRYVKFWKNVRDVIKILLFFKFAKSILHPDQFKVWNKVYISAERCF